VPAQDDARENKIVDLFNLKRPPKHVRHGTDAVLECQGRTLEFELKSVTTKGRSLSTVRDFGPDHIAKLKDKHWLVGVFNGDQVVRCLYGSPQDMAPWIESKWEYIRADFELARQIPALINTEVMHALLGDKKVYTKQDAKRLHKAQYSAQEYSEQMDVKETAKNGTVKGIGYSPQRMLEIVKDRASYVMLRGATLNNPHIPRKFYEGWKEIRAEHAIRLRDFVRDWLDANQPQANVPLQAQHDIPSGGPQNSQ